MKVARRNAPFRSARPWTTFHLAAQPPPMIAARTRAMLTFARTRSSRVGSIGVCLAGRVHGWTISNRTGFPRNEAASTRIATSGLSGNEPVQAVAESA